MTVATPEQYSAMLAAAREGGYAFPAINVTSSQTLNAALQGLSRCRSGRYYSNFCGGSARVSGTKLKDRVVGSRVSRLSHAKLPRSTQTFTVALHTDHCAKQYLGEWVDPLLDMEIEAVRRGEGAALPVAHVGRLDCATAGKPRYCFAFAREIGFGAYRARD